MSNFSSFSSITTMLQTSNIVCQNVSLTDELKICLEYDIHRGLLNIFVKTTDNTIELPSHINILSNQSKESELTLNKKQYLSNSSELQQDLEDEITDISYRDDDDEPKICIEISNIYVYDLLDENEDDLCQTMITSAPLLFSSSSSSSLSSCFDEQTLDNDDGYSTHSLDDIDHQQSISISSSKLIIPSSFYYSEENVSPIRRLIEQRMWLSPFKKTLKQMMMNHLFN